MPDLSADHARSLQQCALCGASYTAECVTGSTSGATTRLNGCSIVQAESVNDVLSLVKDHPYQALGREYSIEAYSLD